MGTEGKLDLTWASYYGPRIKQLKPIAKATAIIEDILFNFLLELSDTLNPDKTDPQKVRELAQRIISQFSQLTISSVAHWIYLIQGSTPPFDEKLFGFNNRQLLAMLYTYLQKQKEWVDNSNKQTAQATSLADREYLTSKALKGAKPEIQKKFDELAEKLARNQKELSIYQTRTYNRK